MLNVDATEFIPFNPSSTPDMVVADEWDYSSSYYDYYPVPAPPPYPCHGFCPPPPSGVPTTSAKAQKDDRQKRPMHKVTIQNLEEEADRIIAELDAKAAKRS